MPLSPNLQVFISVKQVLKIRCLPSTLGTSFCIAHVETLICFTVFTSPLISSFGRLCSQFWARTMGFPSSQILSSQFPLFLRQWMHLFYWGSNCRWSYVLTHGNSSNVFLWLWQFFCHLSTFLEMPGVYTMVQPILWVSCLLVWILNLDRYNLLSCLFLFPPNLSQIFLLLQILLLVSQILILCQVFCLILICWISMWMVFPAWGNYQWYLSLSPQCFWLCLAISWCLCTCGQVMGLRLMVAMYKWTSLFFYPLASPYSVTVWKFIGNTR